MSEFKKLLEPFPQSAIEHKQGMSYIAHDKIRLRVIEATDNAFDWVVTSTDYRIDGAVRARKDGNVPPVMIVTGQLTIPGLGTRTGIGVQTLEAGSGEDMYKGAESDAFKRAAMSFGVALKQLYTDDGKPQREPAPLRAVSAPQNDEPVLFMSGPDTKEWTERVRAVNAMTGTERKDALNALYKEAAGDRNLEKIEVMVAELDYEDANKIASAAETKGLMSNTALDTMIDRGRKRDIEKKQEVAV
jgi:hypothetical protein